MAEIILTVKAYKCERCEHQWIPRKKQYPVICPKCKSPYWDKERSKGQLLDKGGD